MSSIMYISCNSERYSHRMLNSQSIFDDRDLSAFNDTQCIRFKNVESLTLGEDMVGWKSYIAKQRSNPIRRNV